MRNVRDTGVRVTVAQLAETLGASCWGQGDLEVHGAAEPGAAKPGQIALAMSPKYAEQLLPGGLAILAEGMDPEAYGLAAAIFAPRPRLVMAGLTRAFDRGPAEGHSGHHPSAIIDASAEIGEGTIIAPFVTIGADVVIGANCFIGAHASLGRGCHVGDGVILLDRVTLGHDVTVGDRVRIHTGAVIGSDGFSFVTPQPAGVEEIRQSLGQRGEIIDQSWERIHSLGAVELGDDVEIGANTCIDRGTIRATRIGRGTKIDNLVHIGHNVTIGRDCLIAGQCGIAGSARLGDRIVFGGQCGVSDNIFVGDDVIAGGASKLFTNTPAGRVVLGNPAIRMDRQLEIQKAQRRLPRLLSKIGAVRGGINSDPA